MISTSDGSGYWFQANFCSISKVVINTCWWIHSCAVCNYPGWLTDNLNQVASTGYSSKLFLSGQLVESQSILKSPRRYISLLISVTDTGILCVYFLSFCPIHRCRQSVTNQSLIWRHTCSFSLTQSHPLSLVLKASQLVFSGELSFVFATTCHVVC